MTDNNARITQLRYSLYDAIDNGEEEADICRISEELDECLVDAFLNDAEECTEKKPEK